MKYVNPVIIPSTSITPTFNSAAIDTSQMLYVSLQAIVAGGSSPTGTIKLQSSNDPCPPGNLPNNFTPTNWSDIASATASFSADGVVVIPKTDLCYRWIRIVVTYVSGTGTISANLFGICV